MGIISKINYSIKQGIKGIFKNKTMSFISIVSVTSVLAILGIVLSIVLNINTFIKSTKEEVNQITVSLEDNLNNEDSEYIKEEIEKINGVSSLKYETKEEAFSNMKDSFGKDKDLLDGIENPLDDYYIVTIKDSSKIKTLAMKIQKIQGVKQVQYYEDIISNFLKLSTAIKKFGSIIIGFLLIICLVLISNTIKTRVYSKREEIQVIKYIGGSNRFIVAPFIVEGCIIGLFGAILSVTICIELYKYILENMQMELSSVVGQIMLPLSQISILLVGVLFITGILVGILGSGLSVRKYLKV